MLLMRGKELSDDQHSCAGSAGSHSQPVSCGESGAQIRKDLDVAEKVLTS